MWHGALLEADSFQWNTSATVFRRTPESRARIGEPGIDVVLVLDDHHTDGLDEQVDA